MKQFASSPDVCSAQTETPVLRLQLVQRAKLKNKVITRWRLVGRGLPLFVKKVQIRLYKKLDLF